MPCKDMQMDKCVGCCDLLMRVADIVPCWLYTDSPRRTLVQTKLEEA